jgi:hypothetical protein
MTILKQITWENNEFSEIPLSHILFLELIRAKISNIGMAALQII